MTYVEREVRTISLCIAALQSREESVMRRALIKILEDRRGIVGQANRESK